MITTLDELSPAARAAAEAFLDTAVAAIEARLRSEVREDLTTHLCERLAPGATPADVDELVAALGAVGQDDGPAGEQFVKRLAAGFSVRDLGGRMAASLWNPADERLFVPRAFGWGWDLNFGALAVRLGLIEPDAEAVPFTATPPAAFRLAAAVPAGLAAATVLHYLVRGRSLPDRLPDHWDVSGTPDRWVPKARAAATDIAVTSVAAAAAAWAARSTRPAPGRAGVLAAASMAGAIGATTTVLRPTGERCGPLVGPALVLSSLAAVGGVLLGLARAGRRAEMDADLRRTHE